MTRLPDRGSGADPERVEAGRKGGLQTARKRLSHLTDAEVDTLYELEQQARAYRNGTHGEPSAVAAWLRVMADFLSRSEQR